MKEYCVFHSIDFLFENFIPAEMNAKFCCEFLLFEHGVLRLYKFRRTIEREAIVLEKIRTDIFCLL